MIGFVEIAAGGAVVVGMESEIYRYAPDGALKQRFATPFPAPTKPAWGGPARDRIFITSKGEGGGGRLAVWPFAEEGGAQ